jgi:two-component system alkaline phosphatase synthesis response regulator PhoP
MSDTKFKILVVEDESSMRMALKDKFEQADFEVILAENGKVGLEKALKEKPDVILLDILMPEMDGVEMLKKLRKDKWGHEVSVFMLTVLSDMKKISEAMEIGIEGYLVKTDWKLEDVVTKIKDHLESK